jgi:putative ABC transport system permease protein
VRGYFARAARAQLRGGAALRLLAVTGVALGVGSALSIQILNQSALGAFAGSVQAVSGEAQLSVLPRGPSLPDALVPAVIGTPGVRSAIPMVRSEAAIESTRGGTLEVVGADLFAASRLPLSSAEADPGAPLAVPGWVALTPALAQERGWKVGDPLEVSSGSRRVRLQVGALVDFQRIAPLSSRRLAVMDVAQAQALLGAPGQLSQIDVVAEEGVDPGELSRRLEARLGPAVRVATPDQRVSEAEGLLAAFRLNLTALSLVSLFVGGFLVYATVQASLARRREELGVLRSLGATRGQVLGLVLGDAALLGLAGTAAGLPLGWLAARASLGSVSDTLHGLYQLEAIERVVLPPWLAGLGILLGLAGAFVGSFGPALEVAREDPRALLAGRPAGRASPKRDWALALGAWGVAAGVAAATLGPGRRWPPAGFALAVAVLGAVPFTAPLLLRACERLPLPRRLGAAYGARGLASHLRGVAVAVGALAVAVGMLVGITVMVGSFRETVVRWLGATLRADVYVTTPSWSRARSGAVLGPEVLEGLRREPGVRAVDRLRQLTAEAAGRRVTVSGIDAGLPEGRGRVELIGGGEAEALRRLRDEGAALVSEPLARKAGIGQGDVLALQGPSGPFQLPVAGVYRDYGAERGAVLMDLATLAARFGPGPDSNAALYLVPGLEPEAVVERIQARFQGKALLVRSNRTLREQVLSIFERTFAVTRLLQGMAVVIAVAGITLTLLVLARERAGEVALLRALGATRRQIFELFLGRGLGIAALGLALGAAGGAGLALVLVEVINPAWFGWSIGLHLPWDDLAFEAVVVLAAAAAASLHPALRASATPATELSRDAL